MPPKWHPMLTQGANRLPAGLQLPSHRVPSLVSRSRLPPVVTRSRVAAAAACRLRPPPITERKSTWYNSLVLKPLFINPFLLQQYSRICKKEQHQGRPRFGCIVANHNCQLAAMAQTITERKFSVYLYVPNIIGYIRVLMNIVAFALCFTNKTLFAILYFISFVCDGVDGWLARKFNQVSTFGAALDMITDRVSTACLLALLSQLYRPGMIFLFLLGLDIASHWFQMYSTFLSGKASHKDVKDKSNWLLKAYYGHRLFMAFCCVGSEILYIFLFLLFNNKSGSLITVCINVIKGNLLLAVVFSLALSGCLIKQAINVIQLKSAADACVLYDKKRIE